MDLVCLHARPTEGAQHVETHGAADDEVEWTHVLNAFRECLQEVDSIELPSCSLFVCDYPGCGREYRTHDAVRKHARLKHPQWILGKTPAQYCRRCLLL